MKTIKNNNKGLTLVELIVVISIVAIMVGIAVPSISLAFSRDVERCARLIDTEMERVRMNSMSRSGVFTLVIDRINHKLVLIKDDTTRVSTDIALPELNITFHENDGTLIDVKELWIEFDKSAGKVRLVADEEGNRLEKTLFRIRIAADGRDRAIDVVLSEKTGKHFLDF